MHLKDDDGTSQWAVLLDPNGAAFGIIPVVPADTVPESAGDASQDAAFVGRIAWMDLTVADADATRDFYCQVVGWSVHDIEMQDGTERYFDYGMLGEDGTPRAGVCHARGVNAGLPPVWTIYLAVSDLAESIRRVEAEGGAVVKTTPGEDGELAYAAIRDAVGVHLALLQD